MPQWRVRDVMTAEVVTARDDASYAEIAAILASERIGGVPIVDRLRYDLDDTAPAGAASGQADDEPVRGAADPSTQRAPMLAELS